MPRQRLEPKPANPIVIVGVGHMGGAIARGLIAAGLGPRLVLIDPELATKESQKRTKALRAAGADIATHADAIRGTKPTAIVLAVKPQAMAHVAPEYAVAARNALVVSIAAGTTIESLSAWLDAPRGLVRAMPNLPASIGKGITAAFATPTTSEAQRKLARKLLASLGDFVWLSREDLLNAVTATSGSGPAYVFLLVEALAAAAERQGLPSDVAKLLARKTIEGAGALLAGTPSDPADLRRSVTSPGGTTEAALRVLMAQNGLQEIVREAVAAATARGFELAKTR